MEVKFDNILKEGLEKCIQEKGIKDFSSATTQQRGQALCEFYMKEIGQYLYQIFEDDIEDGICDGRGDLGMDMVYRRDKEWLIFQSKYKGQGSHITSGEIADFFHIYTRISNEEHLNKHGNASLQDLLMGFTPGDSIQFIFITNDRITAAGVDEFNRLKLDYEQRHETLNFELKGFSDLKRDYQTVLSEAETLSEEVRINVEQIKDTFLDEKRSAYFDLSSVIDKELKYKSVLCTIKGTTLRSLWQDHQSRLFNYNIRGFLGENAINKKMRDTIQNEPDKFYFYNNGISAICTDIVAEYCGDELNSFRCKNFSIINGAQTTTTIGRYKNDSHLREVRVLLKITKAEDYKKEKGLNKKIIRFSNSQTVIKVSDFRANDDIQVFMESKLPNFIYKGSVPFKKVRYLRKRVKLSKKSDILDITIESLARALYVFDNDPTLIFRATRFLFDTDSENNGKYWFVFGDQGKEVDLYDTRQLEKIAGVFFLWTKIEEKIKLSSKQLKLVDDATMKQQALLAKWHFLWAYGYILRTFYSVDLECIYKRLATGKVFENARDSFVDRWFSKIHNTIAKCIQRNYQANLTRGNKEIRSFNLKNWLRSNNDFEELITDFKYIDPDDFLLDLPRLMAA